MGRSGKHRLKCCVKGCCNIRTDSAFRFPMNELRSQLWLERCRDESLYKYSTLKLWENKRLCEKHFAPHAFTNIDKRRLNFDAVPSIFPYNCASFFDKLCKKYGRGAKCKEEIMQPQANHSAKVPMPVSTEDIQEEYYIIVASPERTEEINQEEYYVIVPSPENTEEIMEKEHDVLEPLPENNEHIIGKEYNLPVTPLVKNENHMPIPSPETTEDTLEQEHQLPMLLPEKPLPANKNEKKKYDLSVPIAACTEVTIKEEPFLPEQSPEDTEDNQQETNSSQDTSCSDRVPVAVKSSNCSKELPRICNFLPKVKNLQESINKNFQKLNIPQPKNIDGNNTLLSAVADQGTPKSVGFPDSCGLAGCTDDLYSDAKNVKQLVKCSSKCGRYFHLPCTGLTKVQYHVMCTSDALRWFCKDCRTRV